MPISLVVMLPGSSIMPCSSPLWSPRPAGARPGLLRLRLILGVRPHPVHFDGATAAVWPGLVPQGVHVVSVYRFPGEGFSPSELLASSDLPFTIGGGPGR